MNRPVKEDDSTIAQLRDMFTSDEEPSDEELSAIESEDSLEAVAEGEFDDSDDSDFDGDDSEEVSEFDGLDDSEEVSEFDGDVEPATYSKGQAIEVEF